MSKSTNVKMIIFPTKPTTFRKSIIIVIIKFSWRARFFGQDVGFPDGKWVKNNATVLLHFGVHQKLAEFAYGAKRR